MTYFEFVEVEKDHQEAGHDPTENRLVVDLVDVKIGHDYEPVVNYNVLGYRLGDVLGVTGFYNNAPTDSIRGMIESDYEHRRRPPQGSDKREASSCSSHMT
ncbi:unnamed protein product [Microthlaspi erraticum]|uniref:GH3 middle domain-containing protein n=1 Tax=Microthlaspi erraticum TaxID=1685480 RepID=A0A6D2ISR0_9BRAS|nr:unnamed protein product [Microthlaspi erraticum]